MIKNKPTFRWIQKFMQENNTEIACIRLGQTYVIPVYSPELAREFVRKQDQTFASRPICMTGKIASSNYLSAALSPAGDQWKKMRKVVASEILSPSMHRFLHVKRCEEADHLMRYVYNQCQTNSNGLVNVRLATQHYSGNVIRKMVFGKRFFGPGAEDGGPGKEEIEHVSGFFKMLPHIYGFAIADYLPWLEVFDFDGYKRIICDGMKSVRKYQDPEIMKRVELWRQGIREKEEDILDVLINLRDSENNPLLSIEEIKLEITDIMTATVDNPSNAAEWAIAEMINQPHILERACEELDRVNYIKSCVKESLRLHPIASFILARQSNKDAIVGDYFIPKGSHVLLSRMGLGRNPRVWKDPLTYDPERHIVGNQDSEVILLARLVQGFHFTAPLDGMKIDLTENEHDLQLTEPLVARAVPRLEPQLYDLPQN
ncbi:valine n-monooxygenase 1 [Phtheirospermum japonicum]|uniref:Valine n-monooxygenase 1 n=1 Tax=Phtheirospermum japonicum TaxID=374723 RepID=A0A830BPA5_9LAMI|nr:valine n-monooxygenase 1 [Phtheirospermum japonicum]